jgi:alpha-tubulin suppressor-like RCC1 family protein
MLQRKVTHSKEKHTRRLKHSLEQRWFRQNVMIFVAMAAVISMMGAAYALLNTTLNIDGQAKIKRSELIRIASVRVPEPAPSCGVSPYSPTWENTSFQVDGMLPNLNCMLVFNITVKNETSDTIYIKQIVEDSFSGAANMEYAFSLTPSSSDAVIAAQGEKQFTLTFRYKPSVSSLPAVTSFVAGFHLVFDIVTPPILASYSDSRNFEIFRGVTSFTPANMNSRIAAVDEIDGVITSQITTSCTTAGGSAVTCPTTWSGLPHGDYNITYNVTNSLGLSAVPITFAVKLWDFVKIDEGTSHAMALTSHGLVWTWGYGATGRLGMGNTSNQTSPVFHTALSGSTGPFVAPARRFIDISANNASSFAITDSGTLWTWGSRAGYALGDSSTSGSVNTATQISLPNGVKAVQLDGYYNTGTVLTDSGDVYVWGIGIYATPTKFSIPKMKYVAMGRYNGAYIDLDGKLWLSGDNNNGQLGVGFAGAGTTASGMSVASTSNVTNTYNGLTGVRKVQIAEDHMIALMENGEVYIWGRAYYGRLCNGGTGTGTTNAYTPFKVPVPGNSPVVDSAIFMNSSHMVTADGKAYSCGGNTYGEIQLGSTSPAAVLNPTVNYQVNSGDIYGITGITAGSETSHVIANNGLAVYGYGYSVRGEVGSGATNNSPTGRLWNLSINSIREW